VFFQFQYYKIQICFLLQIKGYLLIFRSYPGNLSFIFIKIDGSIHIKLNWGMHLSHIKIINKLGVYEYPEKSNGI